MVGVNVGNCRCNWLRIPVVILRGIVVVSNRVSNRVSISEATRLAIELAFHKARWLESSEASNATLGATGEEAFRETLRET